MTVANRQQKRARPHLVKVADRRFMRDMGAGVVALAPDHPTLVQWRYFQRNCDCSPVTETNRAHRLKQLNAATNTLGRVLRADKIAYGANIFDSVQRAEVETRETQQRTLDIFTLDISPPVAPCVQTSVQVCAP